MECIVCGDTSDRYVVVVYPWRKNQDTQDAESQEHRVCSDECRDKLVEECKHGRVD